MIVSGLDVLPRRFFGTSLFRESSDSAFQLVRLSEGGLEAIETKDLDPLLATGLVGKDILEYSVKDGDEEAN